MYVLGFGNPGRGDDGLGPALIERLEALGMPEVYTEAAYQLYIEDAANILGYVTVLFVDADRRGSGSFSIRKLSPARDVTFSSHLLRPESVLAICQEAFGDPPEAWLMGIRGYEFGFCEGLTDEAEINLSEAMIFVEAFIKKMQGDTNE
jgi:hydrogenase maturation protease